MKNWNTANTNTSSHGLMMCVQCHKHINAGDYAYRETADAFITIHRRCMPDCKIWANLDRWRAKMLSKYTARLDAFVAFRAKWNAPILDEEIEEMKRIKAAIKTTNAPTCL